MELHNLLQILIVEDGDEYLDAFTRFIPGFHYLQAKSGDMALDILKRNHIDIVFLDMRFDRTPHSRLLGDHTIATQLCNGDPVRGWKYLEDNQGFFILDTFQRNGYGDMKMVVSYDFSLETDRFEKLKRLYPNLEYVPDNVERHVLQSLFKRCRDRNE